MKTFHERSRSSAAYSLRRFLANKDEDRWQVYFPLGKSTDCTRVQIEVSPILRGGLREAAVVLVPSLAGQLKLRIPPGTNNGRQVRMRGQGLPKGKSGERGDLYAVVDVQLPEHVSHEERELWEKLSRVSRLNPRSHQ